MLKEDAQIIANHSVAPGFYALTLAAPQIAALARPGQFAMLEPAAGQQPFLKRPLGINVIDTENGQVSFVFQVIGQGTRLLSMVREGDTVQLLGPLGQGWRITDGKRALLVGGGAGAAPLLPLARELVNSGVSCEMLLGARGAAELLCAEEFAATANLRIATDDGSRGTKGMVTALLPKMPTLYDMVYCCGPKPLMAKVATWAEQHDLACQVSLEERMGCGFGVCMGCVCSIKKPGSEPAYKRVCCEGPVFDSREVVW